MALLAHNQEVFEDLKKAYEKNNDVMLYHGTGLGKSFLFMELANTVFSGKKILFIVPKHAVSQGVENYDEFMGENIHFETYNYFKTPGMAKVAFDAFDVVVFDECHHLGSDVYGANARGLFGLVRGSDKYILGLTATDKRADKKDVPGYFSEVIIGISIFEAIRRGIVPPFEYLVCSDDAEERVGYDRKVKDFRKKIDPTLSLPLLKDTVARNLRQRWICIFGSIASLEEHEEVIREIFPDDYKIVKISTKHDATVKDIEKYEKTVVLSVDMLIEGVHVKHTDGIIIFRNIQTIAVFQQVLGRVVHVGDTESPIVIDCTRTAIKILAKLLKEDKKSHGTESCPSAKSEKPLLTCSLKNADHFNTTKLLALMSDPYWSKEEDEILRANIKPRMTAALYEEMTALLPKRTAEAIQKRAGILGLNGREHEWSDKELLLLKEKAGSLTMAELRIELPDKTDVAIKSKAKTLGLKIKPTHNYWTNEEVRIIRDNADKMTWKEMEKLLPGRKRGSIKVKANSLGYDHSKGKTWTKRQEEYLKTHYLTTDIETVCKHLKKNKPAVMLHARQMGLYLKGKKDFWTEDKVLFLKQNYLTMDRNEIADHLGLEPMQITSKAARLGLKKK